MERIQVIDSHTAGEPTRVVIAGGPNLGNGSMVERREIFRNQFDTFRSAVVNEPRGNDAMVGALLCTPVERSSTAGVIFFNNVGYLGMCGHGTIGLIATLAWMEKIQPGDHRIETPVGIITAHLHETGEVTINNVESYRKAKQITIEVPRYGAVTGDVAWGGNWFFLVEQHSQRLAMDNLEALIEYTWQIREALTKNGITGDNGHPIDHIELFGAPDRAEDNSKNFVLCPGKAYDRSPCGTGTSAKLACLAGDGKLAEGQIWRQEGIIGGLFEGSYRLVDGKVYPSIKGTAYVNAEAELILDSRDPFCLGIRR
jgi:4-hydroxyproline epimerase